MYEPKPPDYHRNWKAIDIYLFENGNASCPPRKYHLVADQLEWWPVTLSYLANAQYGLMDGYIELYTLDRHKILTPLELKNETAYVAVIPPDPFIEAEYEKYLVRASKSWEKRQSLREHNNSIANTQKSHLPGIQSDTTKVQNENSEVKFFHANSMQTPEESLLIQTVLDNKSADKTNIIVKSTTGNTDKRTSQNNVLPTIRNNRDKRSSQQASVNKNPGSPSQPVPVRRPSLKKRESIKLSDAKITLPPDIDKKNSGLTKNVSAKHESSTEGNISNKSRIYKSLSNRRNSTQPVLSKVDEVINELKKYSDDKDSNLKNINSLNGNEIITFNDKNTDSKLQDNLSTIYIDVTTLKQFKDDLNVEKLKETAKTNIDSSNQIFENGTVNESKQDISQAKQGQIKGSEFNIETPVKEKTQGKEKVTNTSDDHNYSNITDNVEVTTANNAHINVQNNQKPVSLMDTENAPKILEALSATDKSVNIQDNPPKPNNNIIANKPIDVLTFGNKIHDDHSKSDSVTPFQKSVNNGTSEVQKTDRTLIDDKDLNAKKDSAKLFNQNATNNSKEVILSTVSKNQDNEIAPTSEITIEDFIDSINNIKKITSAVYRVEVEAPYDNYATLRGSTIGIASDMTTVNFVDKASNTDEVKILSVNDKTEIVNENSSKSANESSDRFQKKISTSVGREDVVNLKLSIDIWNHNNTINSKTTVPNVSNQNEYHESIPNESNVINKASNTTYENYLKDDQKIVVIKYVSRHPKDEKRISNENSKSNGNNRDFIIIVPILKLDPSAGCCSHCQQKEPINDEDSQKTQQQRVSSIKYPIRRTTSCMSLFHIWSRNLLEVREDLPVNAPVHQSEEPSALHKSTNPSRDPSSTYKDENPSRISSSVDTSHLRESINKRKTVAINEELSYSTLEALKNTNKDQLIVIHDKESEVLEKATNKTIQTGWCNLVMEARLQEDGHYALFLPSIEKLKQYKLHAN